MPYVLISALPIRSYTRLFIPIGQMLPLFLGYLTSVPHVRGRYLSQPRALSGARIAAVAGMLALIAPNVSAIYTEDIEPWNKVCEYVTEHEGQNDAVLITARYMKQCFAACYSGISPIHAFRTVAEATRYAGKHQQVWVIYTHAWSSRSADSKGRARRQLAKHYDLVKRWRASRLIDVYHYVRREAAPPTAGPE